MKNSSGLQYHPNQEDKSGNPTFASTGRVNFSTNEARSTETAHTAPATKPPGLLGSWLKEIERRIKSFQ